MNRMRTLLPVASPSVDLHEFFADGWLGVGGLRVNFISSVDGAATANGLSEGLQTPGDNAVFAVLRDLADVVLVGSRTAAAEGYEPIDLPADRVARRQAFGLAAVPPTAVITRSLRLDPASPLLAGAPPDRRTIVVTCAGSDPDRRAELAKVADVLVCGEQDVDLAAAIRALNERGLTRILCEGGPTLFAELAAVDLVDEVCLTVSPMLLGPGSARIVAGSPWPDPPRRLGLRGLLEDDVALFLRMSRRDGPSR
jgi:riboflavin biosynthesis pyrimidine reductase